MNILLGDGQKRKMSIFFRDGGSINYLDRQKAPLGIISLVINYIIINDMYTYIQVSIAYNSKIAEVMNKGLDDEEELNKELELLKESQSILSCVEERRMYDWSLARSRSGKPERFVWPYEVDITQAPIGDPPPQEAEDEGPTKLTGYFFLAWLILSFTLLIAFNR
ncbi:hypothetical protein ACS0TY_021102 [Phlomoides rotata]